MADIERKRIFSTLMIDGWVHNHYPEEYAVFLDDQERIEQLPDGPEKDLEKKILFNRRTAFCDAFSISVYKTVDDRTNEWVLHAAEIAAGPEDMKNKSLYFGPTPSLYRLIGYHELPFIFPGHHLFTCTHKDGYNYNGNTHYHNLSPEYVRSSINNLDDVICIYKSPSPKSPEALIAILDTDVPELDYKNEPTGRITKLKAVIKPQRYESYHYGYYMVDCNSVSSLFSLEPASRIEIYDMLYVSKEKLPELKNLLNDHCVSKPDAERYLRNVTPGFDVKNVQKYISTVNSRPQYIPISFEPQLLEKANELVRTEEHPDFDVFFDSMVSSSPILHDASVSPEILSFDHAETDINLPLGQEFETDENGKASLEGLKSISRIMSAYANKSYETCRYLIVKDGQILHQQIVNSYMPSAAFIKPNEAILTNTRNFLENNDAELVILHNHPSGLVSPSDEDRTVTQYLENFFRKEDGTSRLAGHIILDHGSYGIYRPGHEWEALVNDAMLPIEEFEKTFQLRLTEHGKRASFNPDCTITDESIRELAGYARQCDAIDHWNTDNWIPALFMTNGGVITSFEQFNVLEFNDREKLAEKLKESGRYNASDRVMFFPHNYKQFLVAERFAQETGKVMEVFLEENGVMEHSHFGKGTIFNDETVRSAVVDESDYFNGAGYIPPAEIMKEKEKTMSDVIEPVTEMEDDVSITVEKSEVAAEADVPSSGSGAPSYNDILEENRLLREQLEQQRMDEERRWKEREDALIKQITERVQQQFYASQQKLEEKINEILVENQNLKAENNGLKEQEQKVEKKEQKRTFTPVSPESDKPESSSRFPLDSEVERQMKEDMYKVGSVVPDFGHVYPDEYIPVRISGAVVSKHIVDGMNSANNQVVLSLTDEKGNRSDITLSEAAYQNIMYTEAEFKSRLLTSRSADFTASLVRQREQDLNLDYYKQRNNTYENFWHNFRNHCRQSTINNHGDAIDLAGWMAKDMKRNEYNLLMDHIRSIGKDAWHWELYKNLEFIQEEKKYDEKTLDIKRFVDGEKNRAVSDTTIFKKCLLKDGENIPDTKTCVGDSIRCSFNMKDPITGDFFSTPEESWTIKQVTVGLEDEKDKALLFCEEKNMFQVVYLSDLVSCCHKRDRLEERTKKRDKKIEKLTWKNNRDRGMPRENRKKEASFRSMS